MTSDVFIAVIAACFLAYPIVARYHKTRAIIAHNRERRARLDDERLWRDDTD